jgi:hypothetical protein
MSFIFQSSTRLIAFAREAAFRTFCPLYTLNMSLPRNKSFFQIFFPLNTLIEGEKRKKYRWGLAGRD